jgi:hypothetical protein
VRPSPGAADRHAQERGRGLRARRHLRQGPRCHHGAPPSLTGARARRQCAYWPAGGGSAQLLARPRRRARSHCRLVLSFIHFIPDSLRDSMPLFLK